MRERFTVKRRLASSVVALALCLAMLAGTTFAWFSDEARTAANTVTAGNLHVALEYKDGEEWKDASIHSLFSEELTSLWEPGKAVLSDEFRVRNTGTLALKYALFAVLEETSGKLGEVIQMAVVTEDELTELGVTAPFTDERRKTVIDYVEALEEGGFAPVESFAEVGTLLPGEEGSDTGGQYVLLYWKPNTDDVDNQYNGIADGLAFHLLLQATQTPEESDSFGNGYDGGILLDPEKAEALENLDEDQRTRGKPFRIVPPGVDPYDLLDMSPEDLEKYYLDENAIKQNPFSIFDKFVDQHGGSLSFADDFDSGENFGTGGISPRYGNYIYELNGHTVTDLFHSQIKGIRDEAGNDVTLTVNNGTLNSNHEYTLHFTGGGLTLNNVTVKNGSGKNNSGAFNVGGSLEFPTDVSIKGCVFDCTSTIAGAVSEKNHHFTAAISDSVFNKPAVLKSIHRLNVTNTVFGELTLNVEKNGSRGTITGGSIGKLTVTANANGSSYYTADVALNNVKIGDLILDDRFGGSPKDVLTLTDCEVTGKFDNEISSVMKLVIVSGTYSFDPTEYKAEGSSVKQAGDRWVVTAAAK